jgi:hypothetical protein
LSSIAKLGAVYREDYLLSLRGLSRKRRPEPVVKMFLQAYRFSQLDFSDYQTVKKEIYLIGDGFMKQN